MTTRRPVNGNRRAETDRLVGLADAADIAGVSTKTIRRWIAEGRLEAYRMGPRLLRVAVDDLNAMVEKVPTLQRRA